MDKNKNYDDRDEHEHRKPLKRKRDKNCFPPMGACFPVVPGAKHKLSREVTTSDTFGTVSVNWVASPGITIDSRGPSWCYSDFNTGSYDYCAPK